MSRRWWMRPAAPTDDEIGREIRAHLERNAAEEIAAGVEPEEAHRRARERFGDEADVAAAMRQAWDDEPPSTARIAMMMASAAAVGFVLFALQRVAHEVKHGATLEMALLLLPSIVVLVIPIGAAAGAAIAAAGPRASRRGRALSRSTAGRILQLATACGIISFVAYLLVPASNSRYLELAWQRAGIQARSFPGVRSVGVAELLALGDPSRPLPAGEAWRGLARREQLARVARFELQKRLALPGACVALALAGMACGAWLRRLRLAPALAVAGALAASGLWYAIYAAAEQRAFASASSAALLAWLPNLGLLAVATAAIALLRRIDRAGCSEAPPVAT